MDFNMKQWRHNAKEQEENISELTEPKLFHLNNSDHNEYISQHYNPPLALPLFVPDQTINTTKFPRMESYFSMAQWQELELQALIYRHMIAGASVPTQLLHLVKKSSNPPFYLSHYPHYQQSLVQTGYWGRGGMDQEPERCRRTDGKKWRCSRDIVTGQKYCERHVNRGRNRSRKPVEIVTSNSATTTTTKSIKTTQGMASNGCIPHFMLSGLSPSTDLLHLSQSPSDSIIEKTGPFEAHNEARMTGDRTLRHFFNDWPRSLDDADGTTNLSISTPGNASSTFLLKLGTGDEDASITRATWEAHPMAQMGGPLAEALRSSTSKCSPTSVLYRLKHGLTSEASYVSS